MALELVLASGSPRRRELLSELGLDARVLPPEVDETVFEGEPPRAAVVRLAETKARQVARTLESEPGHALVLAADTVVVLADEILGKPTDAEDAERMLLRLRGRTHEVVTGVFVLRTDDGASHGDAATTRVRFGSYSDRFVHDYVAGGEPMDKAGAYGIQGRGVLLVRAISGSWSNVVGLPVECLTDWFRRVGIDLDARIRW